MLVPPQSQCQFHERTFVYSKEGTPRTIEIPSRVPNKCILKRYLLVAARALRPPIDGSDESGLLAFGTGSASKAVQAGDVVEVRGDDYQARRPSGIRSTPHRDAMTAGRHGRCILFVSARRGEWRNRRANRIARPSRRRRSIARMENSAPSKATSANRGLRMSSYPTPRSKPASAGI